MKRSAKQLKPLAPQSGRPLYMAVCDAVRNAIEAGIFTPGEQIPSTEELAEQLNVSLVTAQRGLRELVAIGIIVRSQGKGTFVHKDYHKRKDLLARCRLGLVLPRHASLADIFHSHIFEGVRQGAQALAADLVMLRFGEDVRNECNGFLLINPPRLDIKPMLSLIPRKHPALIIGAPDDASSSSAADPSDVQVMDVDQADAARQAVAHVAQLGHKSVGFVGSRGDDSDGNEQLGHSRQRWHGFASACAQRQLSARDQHIVHALSWRLDDRERAALVRILSAPGRPTAVFASGFHFALDTYEAAMRAELRVPEDLSIVAVDDPPSAAFLTPPLTTVRQPLIELGRAAVTAVCSRLQKDQSEWDRFTPANELMVRKSTSPPPGARISR